MDASTDHAQTACGGGTAMAHIGSAGHIVKVNPLTILSGDNAFCTEHHAIGIRIGKRLQCCCDLFHCVGLRCFRAPACKYIIRMMMVMSMIMASASAVLAVLVMVVMLMVMVVIMASASAVLAMFMMVVMLVVMVVIMAAAGADLAMFMMVVMLVVMVVIVAAAGAVLTMFMMVVLLLMEQFLQFIIQSILLSHSFYKLRPCELIPVSGYDGSCGIALPQPLHAVVQFFLGETGCVAEDQAACIGDLIVKEFAEVFLVHLAFLGIHNSGEAVQLDIMGIDALHCLDDITELAHTGGFDEDAVGLVILQHLFQCFAEITHKAAADAAGIHFRDLYTGILQEAAVDADLTELIFDQDEFFADIALSNELFDQGCFSGTEEAGENCNLCHKSTHFFL